MSLLKDIFHKKTPKEQELEIKRLEAETKKIQAEAEMRESRLETRERLIKAKQRLKHDRAKERQSSTLGQTLKGIKDFITVPPTKLSTKPKKSLKSKEKGINKKSKGFIDEMLPF